MSTKMVSVGKRWFVSPFYASPGGNKRPRRGEYVMKGDKEALRLLVEQQSDETRSLLVPRRTS